ncbi:MAG: metallophosphoesterase family protein [Steroidobacteraceae bacterium]
MAREREIRVGLIADTHGLLRPQARSFLLDSDLIVHAGDIGGRGLLEQLQSIAPVSAVRGNNDTEPWAAHLPEAQLIDAGGVRVQVIHNLAELSLDPAAGVQVIVSGHSHRPLLERRDGVLYVNPGSAGPRRFKLPIAIGELLIRGGAVSARIVNLTDERLLVASTL